MASLDKWLYNFAKAQKVPRLKLTGYSRTIGATTVTSLLEDGNNHMLLCSGTSVPSGLDYFAKGCLFIKTDAAALAKAVYENVGTANSCSFNLMGEVAASDIPLTPATILVGNASSVAASVALTGDMSLDSSGVITVTSQMTSKIESQVDVNVSVVDSKLTSEVSDRGVDESVITSVNDSQILQLSNIESRLSSHSI
jgi:NAD(P)-dependent dehydrogenase (short-subunit alcohol dehydrogenase family)